MQKANEEIKSGFYVKPGENSESMEIVENFEMTNDFKELVCLPYFKDLFKVKMNNKYLGFSIKV
jgi:hypothetical protein